MKTNIKSLYLVIFCLFQLTYCFDIRSGMSAPWASIKRNIQKLNKTQKSPLKNLIKKLKDTPYTEKFFTAKVDHFSFENKDTFSLRYLISTKYSTLGGPILFYCGNEGSIEDFWKGGGYLTEDLAKALRATVIYGEHRFFGKSFPYNWKQDHDILKNKYLTVEQAMNDFVDLLLDYKKNNKMESSPIIAFGGSYGGMLSAWSRMKFPHVFAGAVASSAPILLFEDIGKIQNSFFKIVTDTYRKYDEKCPIYVREGFDTLFKLRNSTFFNNNLEILEEINSIFNPCKKMENITELVKLENAIEDAIVSLAQYNYPYEVKSFASLPAYPVKVACKKISAYVEDNLPFSALFQSAYNFSLKKYGQLDDDTKKKLNYLKKVIDVFYNSTGTQKCLDIGNDKTKVNPPNGWEFMACTEMVMPMEKNGVTDMFNPNKWNLEQFKKECIDAWGADVRPESAYNKFGGRNYMKDFSSYSNIFFINGKMDPWNSGCVQKSPNPQTMTVFLADSAHHLDLRTPNKDDPESIIKGREIMKDLVKKWIVDYMRKK